MKDFERFLRDLPKPEVEVPVFRERLRHELRRAARQPAPRPRRGIVAWAAALGLAAGLALFVVVPQIPRRIHDVLFGPAVDVPARVATIEPERPVDPDLAFIEEWSARQERPVAVRTMESERQFRVRQFELSDGKRMLVFSEIGTEATATAEAPTARQAARYF